MVNIRVDRKTVFWAYGAQILQVASSVVLLPFILKKVSSEELGIWYVFLSVSSLVLLLDFGFASTIMRNVTYVFSGAKVLLKEGLNDEKYDSSIDYNLLHTLIIAIKKIYRRIASLSLFFMLTAGSYYIYTVCEKLNNPVKYVYIWVAFSFFTSLNLYYLYFDPLLSGRGLIKWQNKINVISRLANLLVCIVGISLGFGLIAIVAGNIVSIIIVRVLSYSAFYDRELKVKLSSAKKHSIDLIGVLWGNAYKIGLTTLGGFLIVKSNIFILAAFADLKIVASFGLTSQIIAILVSCSQLLFNTQVPVFNSLRIQGKVEELKEIFSFSMVISLFMFILGSVFLLTFGNKILLLLHSKTPILTTNYLFVLLLINLLEFNHVNFAGLIATKNSIPFVKPSLISAAAVILLSYFFYKFLNLGLWSLLLSQGIVQAIYSNWKWPYDVCKEFGVSYFHFFELAFNKIRKYY